MPSGCFFITKIERYIKKQSILFNISIWYYNFIKKLYEIAKERKQKWEVSFMKKKLVLAMAAAMAITSCAVPGKKKIRSLVTGMCANYDRESGLCLPLDCACYMLHKCWTGAYCRYFREAVLPLDPELQAALTTEGISPELRACAVCGKAFLPEGRQAYCSDVCKAEGNRRKSRERMRKMREKRPGGCYDLPPPKA